MAEKRKLFSKEEKKTLLGNLEEMSRDIERCGSELSKKIIAAEIKKQEDRLSRYYRVIYQNEETSYIEIQDEELEKENFEEEYLRELISTMNAMIEKEMKEMK